MFGTDFFFPIYYDIEATFISICMALIGAVFWQPKQKDEFWSISSVCICATAAYRQA